MYIEKEDEKHKGARIMTLSDTTKAATPVTNEMILAELGKQSDRLTRLELANEKPEEEEKYPKPYKEKKDKQPKGLREWMQRHKKKPKKEEEEKE